MLLIAHFFTELFENMKVFSHCTFIDFCFDLDKIKLEI